MRRLLIVLVGCRGSGKSTQLQRLAKRRGYVVLKPSTTRAPRNDSDEEYEFLRAWPREGLLWEIEVGGQKYGMRETQLERLSAEKAGVTVFDPASLSELDSFRREAVDLEVVTIGLDTIESIAEQSRRVGEAEARRLSKAEFERQQRVVQNCDVVLTGDTDAIDLGIRTTAELLSSRGGLLQGDQIGALVEAGTLIRGAMMTNVQAASYDLRLGNEAWCAGKKVLLTAGEPVLTIPAYSFAWVIAREFAHLPRFISGSFDVRVNLFLRGLILSNGPQVDPGYRGALLCMLYNGNDEEAHLQRDEHFATIQFVTTAKSSKGYAGKYQDQVSFEKFLPPSSHKSAGGNIEQRVSGLIQRMEQLESSKISKGELWTLFAIVLGIVLMFVPWIASEKEKLSDLVSNGRAFVERAEKSETNATAAASRAIQAAEQARDSAAQQKGLPATLNGASNDPATNKTK